MIGLTSGKFLLDTNGQRTEISRMEADILSTRNVAVDDWRNADSPIHDEVRHTWTRRQTDILQAARKVLIDKGYGKFSMRQVAKCAGIHLKTLQHYFGSRKALLSEAMNYTLDEHYLAMYDEIDGGISHLEPEKALSWVISFLIDDCRERETDLFFLEFWALAARDPDACEALDNFYVRHRHLIANLIARANLKLSESTVQLRAAVIAEQIEGLVLFIGHNKPKHPEMKGLEVEVHRQIISYALSPE